MEASTDEIKQAIHDVENQALENGRYEFWITRLVEYGHKSVKWGIEQSEKNKQDTPFVLWMIYLNSGINEEVTGKNILDKKRLAKEMKKISFHNNSWLWVVTKMYRCGMVDKDYIIDKLVEWVEKEEAELSIPTEFEDLYGDPDIGVDIESESF